MGEQFEAHVEIKPSRTTFSDILSIRVINHELVNIDECFVTIGYISQYRPDGSKADLPMSSLNLYWEGSSSLSGLTTIRGGDGEKSFHLLSANRDCFRIEYSGALVSESLNTQHEIKPGKYEVEIWFSGKLNGNQFKPVKQRYMIELIIEDTSSTDNRKQHMVIQPLLITEQLKTK